VDSYTRPSELSQIIGGVLGSVFGFIAIIVAIYFGMNNDRFQRLLLRATRRNNRDRSRGSPRDSSIEL
jgi:hypothetical protein